MLHAHVVPVVCWGPSQINHSKRGVVYTCSDRQCRRKVLPHDGHPLFSRGRGQGSEPLAMQAAALLLLVRGSSQAVSSTLLPLNHKAIERLSLALDAVKEEYVLLMEPLIVFGGLGHVGDDEIAPWVDVEADEVDLSKEVVKPADGSEGYVNWEQWAGVLQRGSRKTLALFRLSPAQTSLRAPGPGPIRKEEWANFANVHLNDRRVCLHSDGARSYKLQVPGMLHDHVVHMKKKIKVGNTTKWVRPFFTKKVVHHVGNAEVTTIAGTQTIDRFWRTLRTSLVGRTAPVGSPGLARRIRACQCDYWRKGEDQWNTLAHILTAIRN